MVLNDGLAPLGSRRGYLYLKCDPYLNMGSCHLVFSSGCQRLNTCSHLVGCLYDGIVRVSFSRNVDTSLTVVAHLWQLQHVSDSCSASLTSIVRPWQLFLCTERGQYDYPVQQVVTWHKLVYDLVGQLTTWFAKRKATRRGRSGMPSPFILGTDQTERIL